MQQWLHSMICKYPIVDCSTVFREMAVPDEFRPRSSNENALIRQSRFVDVGVPQRKTFRSVVVYRRALLEQ